MFVNTNNQKNYFKNFSYKKMKGFLYLKQSMNTTKLFQSFDSKKPNSPAMETTAFAQFLIQLKIKANILFALFNQMKEKLSNLKTGLNSIKMYVTSLSAKRNTNSLFSFRPIIVLLAMLLSVGNLFSQTTETLSTGSYIINMGVTPQTNTNGLKPYGLIYDLLKNNNVPIKWVISQTKVKDGADFTYNSVDYKGGTFIIPAEYRTAAVNTKITSYGVTGTTTTSSLTVNVTYTLTNAPTWTLDQLNGSIAAGFFTNAGIPSTAYNMKDPSLLGGCDDIFVLPHADPTWATHGNLYTWNRNNFGSIWAGCHAVSVLENLNNGTVQSNFLATNVGAIGNALVPYGSHSNPSAPFIHQQPTNTAAQYMGITDGAHLNGSEQVYLPKLNGGWRPTTNIIAYDPSQSDVPNLSAGPAGIIVEGRAFGNSNYGWVMYESGHDLDKVGGTASVAAERAFFDWSFRASIDKVPYISSITVPTPMIGGTTYNLSVSAMSPVGNTLSYAWTTSCGGTFSSTTSTNPTFTPSVVTTATNCIITCTVTDACGRKTFSSTAVTITPVPPNAGANQSGICAGTSTTLTGTAPTTGTWSAQASNPAGATLSTTTSGVATASFASTASGIYNFIYTANGLADTMSVTVTAKPNAGVDQTGICSGSNSTLTGTNPTTGTWSAQSNNPAGATLSTTTSGVATASFASTASGIYNFIYTANGCTDTMNVTVTTSPAAPTATVTQPTCAVATGTITISSPTGTGITYSIDGTNYQASTTFSNVAAGTYSVTAKSSAGCVSAVTSVTVNAQPATPAAPTATVTQPTCAVATGTITISAPTGTGITYSIDGTKIGRAHV